MFALLCRADTQVCPYYSHAPKKGYYLLRNASPAWQQKFVFFTRGGSVKGSALCLAHSLLTGEYCSASARILLNYQGTITVQGPHESAGQAAAEYTAVDVWSLSVLFGAVVVVMSLTLGGTLGDS